MASAWETLPPPRTKEEMFDLYKTVGHVMSENDTWSFFLLSGYEDAQKAVAAGGNRKKATKNRKIYNGMMKTYFYQYIQTFIYFLRAFS